MLLSAASDAFRRSIVFLGGKGGVGKTTIAAAFALRESAAGLRTLLVSTDPAHSTGDILQIALGSDSRAVTERCWAMEIDPVAEADRYLAGVKERVALVTPPRLVVEVERQMDVARVAPGMEEAALFERFARIIDEEARDFDRVVFDTAPTGQTLRLLSLPELMSSWMGGLIARRRKVHALSRMWRTVAGSAAADAQAQEDPILSTLEERRQRLHRVREIILDPGRTAFVFVVTPEGLPVRETERAVAVLRKHGIPIGGFLVNQVTPGRAVDPWHRRRGEQEDRYLARIAEAFRIWPVVHVARRDDELAGVDALRRLGEEIFGDSRSGPPDSMARGGA